MLLELHAFIQANRVPLLAGYLALLALTIVAFVVLVIRWPRFRQGLPGPGADITHRQGLPPLLLKGAIALCLFGTVLFGLLRWAFENEDKGMTGYRGTAWFRDDGGIEAQRFRGDYRLLKNCCETRLRRCALPSPSPIWLDMSRSLRCVRLASGSLATFFNSQPISGSGAGSLADRTEALFEIFDETL